MTSSTDNTVHLFDMLCSKFCLSFVRVKSQQQNVGFLLSYSILLEASLGYQFIFLCDHDDIWLSDKISSQISVLKSTPLLPSLCVANSFIGTPGSHSSTTLKESLRWSKHYFKSLFSVLDPRIPGFCMAFNDKLLSAVLPFPADIRFHDQHIYRVAYHLRARITVLNQPLAYYRIHSSNSVGFLPGRKFSTISLFSYFFDIYFDSIQICKSLKLPFFYSPLLYYYVSFTFLFRLFY